MSDKMEGEGVVEQQNVEIKYSDLAEKDTKLNIKCLHCKRCGSKIVKESVATLIEDRKVSHF